MQIQLGLKTFRILVKLYLWALPLLIAIAAVEFSISSNLEFSDGFDALAAAHYKPIISQNAMLSILFIGALAHFIAALALLKLKIWARPIFVFVPLALSLLDIVTLGVPGYTSPILSLFIMIDTSLYGAIALLCYGSDQGVVWFANKEPLGK